MSFRIRSYNPSEQQECHPQVEEKTSKTNKISKNNKNTSKNTTKTEDTNQKPILSRVSVGNGGFKSRHSSNGMCDYF